MPHRLLPIGVLLVATAAVIVSVAWLSPLPSSRPLPGAATSGTALTPSSAVPEGDGPLAASSSPGAATPNAAGSPTSPPPGTSVPGESPTGPRAEVVQGLTGETARLAIRIEEAFTNPDRRSVSRIRGEMLRLARTQPDTLIELARKAPKPRHRSWALRVLGEARVPEARAAAGGCLADGVDYVRQNAAWTLGQIGTRDDIPPLEALAHSESERDSVRNAARDAVSAILSR